MASLDIECVISGSETGGAVSVFEEVNQPGDGPPLHAHRDQTEIFHIIEGELKFVVGGQEFTLGPGGSAVVPPGTPHAFKNVGSGPARFHFELLPALNTEEAFERMVNRPESITDLASFFAESGIDLLGPPLA